MTHRIAIPAKRVMMVAVSGECLVRRKEIYEMKWMETKQGAKQAAGMNRVLGNNVSADSAPTFVTDTSAKTGVSSRVIHEAG